jgi:hypothetical protein
MRAAGSTYALFSIVFGLLIVFFVFVALRSPAGAKNMWLPVELMGALLGVLLVQFACLEVRVSQGVLSYRSLFGRRSILLSDVARSRLESVSRYPGRTVYLVITPAHGGKPLKFILKPFRLEDVRQLLAIPALKYHQG